ncbi:S1C family serine protease [Microseira sp. BLCC-F43]|jgi:S1-C subfamily serine protease|uniref:S1C family serine protease n=1 Tax=Microseira sp. BLCC-F43 TaxID=3153602 RepID=UPI0035BA850B
MSADQSNAIVTLSNNLADAVERAGGAVVGINARQRMTSSGVHWRSGFIVTADHTIRRDDEITVILPDNRTVTATLAGRDTSTDLAVLKLEEIDFPTAAIGDVDSLKVGNIVLALGRSSDRSLTASWGVVSAKGGAWRTWRGGQIDQLLLPDLTLYPGMDGGPLVDSSGCVVGINTAGLSRRSDVTIPVSTVNRVVNQLLEAGHIKRGYLGVGMQPVRLPDVLIKQLNLSSGGGAIAVNIEPNGPADKAGMLLGDVIVSLDDNPINDTYDVLAMLGSDSVGKTMQARVIRGGILVELGITVGERVRQE